MISEKFDTQTVAVYDYTIRKRTTEDLPQVKDGTAPLSPAQASVFSLPLSSLKFTKSSALGSKSTSIRRIGRLSGVSGCILEKMPLSVSSVGPPSPGSAMFGDRLLGRSMIVLSLRRTLDHSIRSVILGRHSRLLLAAERAKVRWFAITRNSGGTTSPKWRLTNVSF